MYSLLPSQSKLSCSEPPVFRSIDSEFQIHITHCRMLPCIISQLQNYITLRSLKKSPVPESYSSAANNIVALKYFEKKPIRNVCFVCCTVSNVYFKKSIIFKYEAACAIQSTHVHVVNVDRWEEISWWTRKGLLGIFTAARSLPIGPLCKKFWTTSRLVSLSIVV